MSTSNYGQNEDEMEADEGDGGDENGQEVDRSRQHHDHREGPLIDNVNVEGVEAICDNDDNNDDNEDIEMLFNSPINYEEITESIK